MAKHRALVIFVGLQFSAIGLANPIRTITAPKVKFPYLEVNQGEVFLRGKDSQKKKVIKQVELIEIANIQTKNNARATIELDNLRKVRIEPNSEIDIPSISRDSGEAPYIHILSGSIYWKQELNSRSIYPLTIRTNLSEQTAQPGNYVIRYDPDVPSIEVLVINGYLEFSGLHHEDTVGLKAGQKAKFTGALEAGEIAYDRLLKGKKVARGTMGKLEELTSKEKEVYAPEFEKKEKERIVELERWKEKKKRQLKPGQICRAPNAKYNECAWICVGNPGLDEKCRLDLPGVQCQKFRCNASGKWAEGEPVSKTEAKFYCPSSIRIESKVGNCPP